MVLAHYKTIRRSYILYLALFKEIPACWFYRVSGTKKLLSATTPTLTIILLLKLLILLATKFDWASKLLSLYLFIEKKSGKRFKFKRKNKIAQGSSQRNTSSI